MPGFSDLQINLNDPRHFYIHRSTSIDTDILKSRPPGAHVVFPTLTERHIYQGVHNGK